MNARRLSARQWSMVESRANMEIHKSVFIHKELQYNYTLLLYFIAKVFGIMYTKKTTFFISLFLPFQTFRFRDDMFHLLCCVYVYCTACVLFYLCLDLFSSGAYLEILTSHQYFKCIDFSIFYQKWSLFGHLTVFPLHYHHCLLIFQSVHAPHLLTVACFYSRVTFFGHNSGKNNAPIEMILDSFERKYEIPAIYRMLLCSFFNSHSHPLPFYGH
jgi:hypothetical protein